jgi:hypothetical protein
MLAFAWKLAMAAQKSFRRLRGFAHLTKVIEGVKFVDGVEQRRHRKQMKSSRALPPNHSVIHQTGP